MRMLFRFVSMLQKVSFKRLTLSFLGLLSLHVFSGSLVGQETQTQVPKIEDVRLQIQKQLIENKVSADLQKYIDTARDGAEIVILKAL